jgi:hypothetical protein
MSLDTNNALGMTRTLAYIKKLLTNEFQKPRSKDQYMNEMIKIRKKPGDFIWDIDQRFKRMKGKLKYLMNNMKHWHLFVNSLLPTLEITIATKKVSDAGRGCTGNLPTGRKPVPADGPIY